MGRFYSLFTLHANCQHAREFVMSYFHNGVQVEKILYPELYSQKECLLKLLLGNGTRYLCPHYVCQRKSYQCDVNGEGSVVPIVRTSKHSEQKYNLSLSALLVTWYYSLSFVQCIYSFPQRGETTKIYLFMLSSSKVKILWYSLRSECLF